MVSFEASLIESVDERVIVLSVEKTVLSNFIVSSPAWFAAVPIAARNDPAPESFVFITVIVAGTIRSSIRSSKTSLARMFENEKRREFLFLRRLERFIVVILMS